MLRHGGLGNVYLLRYNLRVSFLETCTNAMPLKERSTCFLDDDPSFSVNSGTRNADWCHSPYRYGTKFILCNTVRQEGGE